MRLITLVALQKVTRRTEPLWTRAFELLGLVHVRSAWGDGERARAAEHRPAMWVMVASRTSLTDVVQPLVVPRPGSAVTAAVETDLGPVEVYCVHVPNAANGWVKVRTLDDLLRPRHARSRPSRPRKRVGRRRARRRSGAARGRLPRRLSDPARLRCPRAERIAGHGGGWRLDHVFASSPLHPIACEYHHGWREQDLSDHSALEVDFACRAPP